MPQNALKPGVSIKHGINNNQPDPFLLEMDKSEELRQMNPLGINGLTPDKAMIVATI